MLHKVGKFLAWPSSADSELVETLGAGKINPLGAAGMAAETFPFPLLSLEIVLVCSCLENGAVRGPGRAGGGFSTGKVPPNSGFPVKLSFCAASVLFSVESFQPLDVEEDGVYRHSCDRGVHVNLFVLSSLFSGCFFLNSSICRSSLYKL